MAKVFGPMLGAPKSNLEGFKGMKPLPRTNLFDLNKKFLSFQEEEDAKVTTESFCRMYPSSPMTALGYDPLVAIYFDEFNKDPEVVNAETQEMRKKAEEKYGHIYVLNITSRDRHHPLRAHRKFDLRLNVEEKTRLQTHGLVVSERLGVESFAEGYDRLYSDNLPVFITADSILHAWHRSFDAILKELEELCLMKMLNRILASMQGVLKRIPDQSNGADTDYFIAVARRLLSKEDRSFITMNENEKRYLETLNMIEKQQTMSIDMFGKRRDVDFSQFKPRGHYDSSEDMKRYFKAMMWLGRIDLRVNGKESNAEQVQCAIMLVLLVRTSEEGMALWNAFSETLRVFIGPVDSMSVEDLNTVLENMVNASELDGITSMDQLWTPSVDTIAQIKSKLSELSIGKQVINSHVRHTRPDMTCPMDLPQSFTFLGQRFTLEAFAMSRVVYDNLVWEGELVQRRIPSAVDVAFSVFQNDNVVEEIARRAKDSSETAVKYRDGLPYVHALLATRRLVDSMSEEQWSESLYSMWLNCLRKLSLSPKHPSSAFQSKAWAMRMLNAQLGSYTELKHDTILYAKQSYTMSTCCEHADVFVEPIPEFWSSVRQMAERAATLLKTIKLDDDAERGTDTPRQLHSPSHAHALVLEELSQIFASINLDDEAERDADTPRQLYSHARHASFLKEFSQIIAKLETASVQLSNKEALSEEQIFFLKSVMEERHGSGATRYDGWYPKLFYSSREDSGKWDPLVADIHTDPPDETVEDPGCVIHQAVGNVFMGLFSVNMGSVGNPKPIMFAGPVYSYYEFHLPFDQRMADSEWRDMMRKNPSAMPLLPDWATSTYLAAGASNDTANFCHRDD